MLANVLIESFMLTDIKLGDQERNRQITKLITSPIIINRYTVLVIAPVHV
jgi:hypothetical protein